MTAANQAVQGVLLSLYGRLTGQGGANIDVSLMAAAASLMCGSFTENMATGRLPPRQGNQNSLLAPAGAFEVAGGRFITIAVLRDSHWQKFCVALALEALAGDERFATNAARVKNRDALDRIIVPQLLECGLVGIAPPALVQHRAVPLQAVGLEGAQDIVSRTGHLARRVDVVDAHQPFAAAGAGVGWLFNIGEWFALGPVVRGGAVFLGGISILTLSALWSAIRAFGRKRAPEGRPSCPPTDFSSATMKSTPLRTSW